MKQRSICYEKPKNNFYDHLRSCACTQHSYSICGGDSGEREKLPAVLERNAALWERVNDEYDEKIAADEPDMTFELNEADFDDACPAEESYAESIKSMRSLTEKEKVALLADLAEIESLEAQIDELYYRMTDENADRLYGEIDALYEKLDAVLDRNAELWDRVDAEYDEKIAAIEPDMPFELEEDDLAVCEKGR